MDTSITLTGASSFEQLLGITGTLVTLMSAVATFFNGRIRERQSAGEAVTPGILKAVATLNVFAVNLDKAKQLFLLAKGAEAAVTTPRPGFPCPTCGQVVPPPAAPTEPEVTFPAAP